VTASKPWYYIAAHNMFDNPKMISAQERGGYGALVLYQHGLGYSVRHLTDGYVPLPMPKRWGHTARHIDALVVSELWHPVNDLPIDGSDTLGPPAGWLIHDYSDYQISRADWEAKIQQRRDAAKKRWTK
jgi:hypothetical protein